MFGVIDEKTGGEKDDEKIDRSQIVPESSLERGKLSHEEQKL